MTYSGNHIVNEHTLAERCRTGDRIAERHLYDLYVDFMMITCLRYITDSENAKEVMLDGFVNGFKNIDSFQYRGEGSLKAWLKKIMINQCLMFLRSRKALNMQFGDVEYIGDSTMDTNALTNLHVKDILLIIQQLPNGYRTVFNLYVFEGLTHKEIALLLGISESTSKSQLYKARQQLQKLLRSHIEIIKT